MTAALFTHVDRLSMRHYLDALCGTWDDQRAGVLPLWDDRSEASVFLPIHDLEASVELAAERIERGWSGHVGMALHPQSPTSGRGRQVTTCAMAGPWADVDVRGPSHREDALPETLEDALALIRRAVQPEPSLLVDSGHGLHAYWLLREVWDFRLGGDECGERKRARSLSDQVQRAIRQEGHRAGYAIEATADLARVLRIPGSLNTKVSEEPRQVHVIGESGIRYGIEELEELLPAIPPDERRHTPRSFTGTEIPAQLGPILDGCAFVRHVRDDAATLSYGEWHAGLTIVARCEDGVRHAHALSAPYPRYDRDKTQGKYDDAHEGNKPYRCATIATLSTEAAACCASCPHRGMISTPVQLGRPQRGSPQLEETAPLHMVDSPAANGSGNGHHASNDESGNGATRKSNDVERVRPVIDAGDADLERTSTQAWEALQQVNEPPRMFRFGGLPVRVAGAEDDGPPVAQTLTEDRLSHELARAATWFKTGDKDVIKPAAPPLRLVRDMLAAPVYPLPPLLSIVQVPVLAPDGTLQVHPGYHPAAQNFYAPVPGFDIAPVPETPTVEDVACARSLIVDDLLGDFPFCRDADRANAVALALDRYVRNLVDGPTPLRQIEAPTAGSGKGLLADVLLRPGVGRRINIMPAANDDDEWRKRITAQLLQLPEVILIDNITSALDSGSLSAALTASWWTDRRLGVSEMVRVPVRCAWVATANNPVMSTELARRTVRTRLDPKVDRPWQRTGFRHENLREWADAHRADLVWSALVLVRHWIAEGRPLGTNKLGSFEQWSAVLGGILGCIGIEGFLGNLDAFYEEADLEGATWRHFVAAWFAKYGEEEVGVAKLFGIALTVDGFDFGKGTDRAQRTAFGQALNRQRDRVNGEYCIINTRTVHRVKRWRLIRARDGSNPFAALYEGPGLSVPWEDQ